MNLNIFFTILFFKGDYLRNYAILSTFTPGETNLLFLKDEGACTV